MSQFEKIIIMKMYEDLILQIHELIKQVKLVPGDSLSLVRYEIALQEHIEVLEAVKHGDCEGAKLVIQRRFQRLNENVVKGGRAFGYD